jgi:hypothetical protein
MDPPVRRSGLFSPERKSGLIRPPSDQREEPLRPGEPHPWTQSRKDRRAERTAMLEPRGAHERASHMIAAVRASRRGVVGCHGMKPSGLLPREMSGADYRLPPAAARACCCRAAPVDARCTFFLCPSHFSTVALKVSGANGLLM